jgi:hypothetical protein
METVTTRRYRLTLRAMMIIIAACALLLFPYARMVRKIEQLRQGRLRGAYEAKIARDLGRKTRQEALRAIHLARAKAALASPESPRLEATKDGSGGHVWAALSVNHPIVRQGEAANLEVEFDLVNETNQGIDPRIPESRIVVNGKELAESGLIMGRTPRTSRFQRLLPGEDLHFVGTFRHEFEEPGTYQVVWEGAGFLAPGVVIRVLPRRRSDP